ncbi:uncharacterized protein LAESUDRAFT_262553 [Laetiporus sulphureus 93-53]|uniref:Ketoreductase (KR) domain-containing protein n=1 Tax=Laetiporus sulphureus 93-53 TaxID=1314785 RepID=A0A165H633_9APHY|nr:uncharacterized protein LAESUDRAFT_262553 [Laetiporus sulphureus 93-53]KZT11294.1 hypothetical protein LAESUDRAFT_262553 [Laetiporus sulphureus 93-53]
MASSPIWWRLCRYPIVTTVTTNVLSYLLSLVLRMLFYSLDQVITTAEHVEERLLQVFSTVFHVPGCDIYKPEESAIVVLGGEYETGKQIAIHFSKLGYTVFALCRAQESSQYSDIVGTSADKQSISSLLHEWHQRRKHSDGRHYGLLAPMTFEMHSMSKSAHAFETIHACCETHSPHLIAAILLPEPNDSPNHPAGITGYHSAAPHAEQSPELDIALSRLSSWSNCTSRTIDELMHVISHCLDLLLASSGRVVLISEQPDLLHSVRTSASQPVHAAVAASLMRELEPLGIAISLVRTSSLTDPLRNSNKEQSGDRTIRESAKELSRNGR